MTQCVIASQLEILRTVLRLVTVNSCRFVVWVLPASAGIVRVITVFLRWPGNRGLTPVFLMICRWQWKTPTYIADNLGITDDY